MGGERGCGRGLHKRTRSELESSSLPAQLQGWGEVVYYRTSGKIGTARGYSSYVDGGFETKNHAEH